MKFYQFFTAILLVICGIMGQVALELCREAPPTQQTTVEVVMYFNGGNTRDMDVLKGMCDSRAKMPTSVIPITFKIGATVKQINNKYICKDNDHVELPSCRGIFTYACMSELLDQTKFYDLMCCVEAKNNDMDACVAQIGYTTPLEDCMAGKLETPIDPGKIALDNSNEAAGFGANQDKDLPPYFLFKGKFDKCTSEQAADDFAGVVCNSLTYEALLKVPACN